MKTTRKVHQTILLPQGEEGSLILQEILGGKLSWGDAHERIPGEDIVIEESSLFDSLDDDEE